MIFNPLREKMLDYMTQMPATGENPQITDWELIQETPRSAVYRFTLGFDEAESRTHQIFILKTFTDTPEGKDRALKERHALYNLRSARYNVPSVLAVETDNDHIGIPFIIMEFIKGDTLQARLPHADDKARHEMARQFVSLMTSLHEMGTKTLVPRMQALSEKALLNREIHTLRKLVSTHGLDSAFEKVLDWLYENRVVCLAPVVTHRDFLPSNIMVNPHGMFYVVDWGWQIGDPRFDVAVTLTGLARNGQSAFADAVRAEYVRVSGGDVPALPYFEVLAELAWLIEKLVAFKTRTFVDETAREQFVGEWLEPARYSAYAITQATQLPLPPIESLFG